MTTEFSQMMKETASFNKKLIPKIHEKLNIQMSALGLNNKNVTEEDLRNDRHYKFIEKPEKLVYKIKKQHVELEFDVIPQNGTVKIENLFSKDIPTTKKNKITLLIGNGVWRSITNKIDGSDTMALKNIFKAYRNKNNEVDNILEDDSEEAFGRLDMLCDIYENCEKYKKYFKEEEMQEVAKQRNKLFEYVASEIRKKGDEINTSPPYKTLINEIDKFIKGNNVDIATLNYDQLLYDLIIDKNKSYSDGFKGKKDEELKFDRGFYKWIHKTRHPYLHLHGSLLFANKEKSVTKLRRSELDKNEHPLMILTANQSKYQKIHQDNDEDFIFHVYNQRFVQSLCNNNLLTIIGYGFLDEYLNNDIKYALAKNKKLRINLICRQEDVGMYKNKLISSSNENKDRIVTTELEHICDVNASQLAKVQ